PIFARYRLNITIVAGWAKVELFKNRNGVRIKLFHVADDRVTADQLIESKHRSRPSERWVMHLGGQRFPLCFQLSAGALKPRWVKCPNFTRFYSWRMAMAGSTRDALRAGTKLASMATARSRIAVLP